MDLPVGHGPHNFQNTLVKAHKITKTTYQSNAKEPATGPAVRPVIISRTHCRASWTCSLLWPVTRSSLGPLFRARMLTSQPVADRTALRSAAVKVTLSPWTASWWMMDMAESCSKNETLTGMMFHTNLQWCLLHAGCKWTHGVPWLCLKMDTCLPWFCLGSGP